MEVNGRTGILGIFGKPVTHTLSPVIHNTLSEELGNNLIYVPFPVDEDIESAVKGAYAMGVKGINVTVPYKQDVIPFLADIDENAKKIGAVNTLVRTESGFKGYNTDMMGLLRGTKRNGIELEGKKVIIIGAGGASRAVIYMCMLEKAEKIYILNRSVEKAKSLSDEMNMLFDCDRSIALAAEDYKDIPEDKYVMFQCTSLGLKETDSLLIQDEDFYDMAEVGYDLIYNPAFTPFMRELNQRGIPAYNGLTMLLYQGIIAYELWTDSSISDELSDIVLSAMERKIYGNNIVLVGYMGSGKTTVGKYISEKYNMKFLDTDQYIVEKEGISINEIFARFGEEKFREIETDAIRELSGKCYNTVISCGGGIVLKEENRKLLKKLGKVFFLNASPEEVYSRIKGDTERPLLKSNSEAEVRNKIGTMITKRMPYYAQAADTFVNVDQRSFENIAEEIMS